MVHFPSLSTAFSRGILLLIWYAIGRQAARRAEPNVEKIKKAGFILRGKKIIDDFETGRNVISRLKIFQGAIKNR